MVITYFLLLLTFVLHIQSLNFDPYKLLNVNSTSKITILHWTSIWSSWKPEIVKCPPIADCIYTRDKSAFKKANAVIFLYQKLNPKQIPKRYNNKQLFIYQNFEPEIGVYKSKQKWLKNFYNYTQTYSSNSDFYKPYGGPWIKNKIKTKYEQYFTANFTTNPEKILKGKEKEIFWSVSHCKTHSKREESIKKLKKFIEIYQYGKCNEKNLTFYMDSEEYQSLVSKHYFYIASENRDCSEYITEKYWKRIHLNSIPIVNSRNIYKDHVPPHSIIAMDDFESPKDMAKYLYFLIQNPEQYLKYFEYRKEGWKLWNLDKTEYYYCQTCLYLKHFLNEKKKYKLAEKSLATKSRCLKDGYVISRWKKFENL